jgi:hypothetical protein
LPAPPLELPPELLPPEPPFAVEPPEPPLPELLQLLIAIIEARAAAPTVPMSPFRMRPREFLGFESIFVMSVTPPPKLVQEIDTKMRCLSSRVGSLGDAVQIKKADPQKSVSWQ